jgi:hypothetical protein
VTTILAWSYLALVIGVPLTLALLSFAPVRRRLWRRRLRPGHRAAELYAIRRRFDVFQFKHETLRYEQYARRQMARELAELRRKGWQR